MVLNIKAATYRKPDKNNYTKIQKGKSTQPRQLKVWNPQLMEIKKENLEITRINIPQCMSIKKEILGKFKNSANQEN